VYLIIHLSPASGLLTIANRITYYLLCLAFPVTVAMENGSTVVVVGPEDEESVTRKDDLLRDEK
jgi:hypothetical protein